MTDYFTGTLMLIGSIFAWWPHWVLSACPTPLHACTRNQSRYIRRRPDDHSRSFFLPAGGMSLRAATVITLLLSQWPHTLLAVPHTEAAWLCPTAPGSTNLKIKKNKGLLHLEAS